MSASNRHVEKHVFKLEKTDAVSCIFSCVEYTYTKISEKSKHAAHICSTRGRKKNVVSGHERKGRSSRAIIMQ